MHLVFALSAQKPRLKGIREPRERNSLPHQIWFLRAQRKNQGERNMAKRKLAKASASKPSSRKKTPWIFWVIAGGVGVVIVAVIAYLAFEAGRAPEVKVGKPAPDFTLTLFNGQGVTLSSLKGRPVLLNFWAST
jgi:hypothetical protein